MKKSGFYLIISLLWSILFLILSPVKVSAVDLVEVVAQSQVGDKVQEISKDSFYSYNGACGSSACPYPTNTGWTNKGFDDSSWAQAQDAFVTNQGSAQHWWCDIFPSNCHPFGVTQIVGPNGFVDGETLLFRKKYTIPNKTGYRIKDVKLELWSDNNSWAYIDGQFVTGAGLSNIQTASTNPNTVTTYSVSALSLTSSASTATGITNQLVIQVSNDNQGEGNPIGVAYKVTAVYEQTNNSTCGIITPDSVTAGQTFNATVTLNNTGSTTWNSGANYKLGSANLNDNTKWGRSRVDLPSTTGSGQPVTFSFQATAPTSTGPHDFSWQMVQEGVEWFGPVCSKSITVSSREKRSGPLSGSCSTSKTTANINEQIIWQSVPSGGDGNYTYYWFGDVSGSNQNITTSYSSTGVKSGKLIIKSGDGQIFPTGSDPNTGSGALACGSVTINSSLSLSCFAPQPTSGQLETQFILNSSAKDGTGNYIYYWNIQEPNKYPKLLGGTSSSSSIPWTPTTEGTTTASATVYSNSQSASCSVDFNVKGHIPSSFNPGNVTSFCAGANNPRMDVTWYASKYATSYKIDRWTFINGNIAFEKTIDTIPSNGLIQFQAEKNNDFTYRYWFSDSNPPFYTSIYYFYHITAINNNGPSDTWVVGSNGISCPAPSVDLKVNGSDGPVTLNEGATPTVTWTSQNTYSCYVNTSKSNVWPGYHYYSGEKTEPLLSSNSPVTFFIQCSGITTGTYADDQVKVNVTPPPLPPLSVSCLPDNSYVTKGTPITWTATVSGGRAPYTYRWSGDASRTDNPSSATTSQISRSFQTTGAREVFVTVTSSDSQTTGLWSCGGKVIVGDAPPGAFYFYQPATSCSTTNSPTLNLKWGPSLPYDPSNELILVVGHVKPNNDYDPEYISIPASQRTYTYNAAPGKRYYLWQTVMGNWGGNMGVRPDYVPAKNPNAPENARVPVDNWWDYTSTSESLRYDITAPVCVGGSYYLNNTNTPFTGSFEVNSADINGEVFYETGTGKFTMPLTPSPKGGRSYYGLYLYPPSGHKIIDSPFSYGCGEDRINIFPCNSIIYSNIESWRFGTTGGPNVDVIVEQVSVPPPVIYVTPPVIYPTPALPLPPPLPASSKPPYIQTKDGDVHSNIEIKGSQ